MEAIANFSDKTVGSIVHPTREIFLPLLMARKFEISQTPKKTFQYGATERHKLDVYYPPYGMSNVPILFFVHGGGFTTGSRDLFPGLVFDNIGAFFAKRGILTVIADYRLAPGATYPSPVKDIRDAIRFTLTSSVVNVIGCGADMSRIYIFGHSAGGAHVSTLFLDEDILTEHDRSLLSGAIILSGMYGGAPYLTMYYGEPQEEVNKKCPLGLLNRKSSEKVSQLLPHRLFLLVCENEDPGLAVWDQTFQEALQDKGVTNFFTYTLMGHNHASPEVSLFSGEGEEWGEKVVRWIKA